MIRELELLSHEQFSRNEVEATNDRPRDSQPDEELLDAYSRAVITAAEIKRPGWKFNPNDRREKAQNAFIEWIRNHGGFAGFVSCLDDLKRMLGL